MVSCFAAKRAERVKSQHIKAQFCSHEKLNSFLYRCPKISSHDTSHRSWGPHQSKRTATLSSYEGLAASWAQRGDASAPSSSARVAERCCPRLAPLAGAQEVREPSVVRLSSLPLLVWNARGWRGSPCAAGRWPFCQRPAPSYSQAGFLRACFRFAFESLDLEVQGRFALSVEKSFDLRTPTRAPPARYLRPRLRTSMHACRLVACLPPCSKTAARRGCCCSGSSTAPSTDRTTTTRKSRLVPISPPDASHASD
eukprot:6200055-Pleurochrysis_carterae.AAC.8